MILGKNGACEDGTGNNGTNGEVDKNVTLMLNFSKLKPQTLHPKPHLLTQTPPPTSRTRNTNFKSSPQTPSSNSFTLILKMCHFCLLF